MMKYTGRLKKKIRSSCLEEGRSGWELGECTWEYFRALCECAYSCCRIWSVFSKVFSFDFLSIFPHIGLHLSISTGWFLSQTMWIPNNLTYYPVLSLSLHFNNFYSDCIISYKTISVVLSSGVIMFVFHAGFFNLNTHLYI